MTGVIYARYSSDNQREESIEGQIRENTAFAEKNGITIVGHYIDRAYSAKTDNRPEFQRMIRDSAKKTFDVVIVWKLDRFSRNRYDSAKYKAALKKNNVRVVSATEGISEGAEGIILESVLEGMAEYYSADLAEKVTRGLTENALKCRFNGGNGLPYGYTVDEENKVIPLLEARLKEVRKSIDNVVKAIEAGIITRSTKAKLEHLEAEEEQIELNILKEQTSTPKLTKEQILFALDKFRKLDLTIEANKERLIDSLVKCVLLYDDKLVITFNFKNEPVTVPTSEEFDEIEKSSDIKAFASPKQKGHHTGVLFVLATHGRTNSAPQEKRSGAEY